MPGVGSANSFRFAIPAEATFRSWGFSDLGESSRYDVAVSKMARCGRRSRISFWDLELSSLHSPVGFGVCDLPRGGLYRDINIDIYRTHQYVPVLAIRPAFPAKKSRLGLSSCVHICVLTYKLIHKMLCRYQGSGLQVQAVDGPRVRRKYSGCNGGEEST